MATILRNGPLERVSFSDTEIDEDKLEPTVPGPLGMHSDSGFQRVIDGNAFFGHVPRARLVAQERRRARRMRVVLVSVVLVAIASAALSVYFR